MNNLKIIKSCINEELYIVLPSGIFRNSFEIYHLPYSSENDSCVVFSINPEFINVIAIQKCGHLRGTEIIELIENISKKLNISRITLLDASNIEIRNRCSFDLAIISILSSGMSWYNKLGYISDEHELEISFNRHLINFRLYDFLEYAKNKKIDSLTESLRNKENNFMSNRRLTPVSLHKLKKIIMNKYNSNIHVNKLQFVKNSISEYIRNEIDKINTEFEDKISLLSEINHTKTIKQFVNEFKIKLKNKKNNINCNCDETNLILYILHIAKYALLYSGKLHKNL